MNEEIKKAKELIEGQISCAKDDLQHYTMVDFDSAKAKQSEFDLRDLNIVKSALNQAEENEIQNKILKEHQKELIKVQHELFDIAKENENALKIIIEKDINMPLLMTMFRHNTLTLENYNINCSLGLEQYKITQDEFDLIKKVVEKYGR